MVNQEYVEMCNRSDNRKKVKCRVPFFENDLRLANLIELSPRSIRTFHVNGNFRIDYYFKVSQRNIN